MVMPDIQSSASQRIVIINEPSVRLKAFIAIHSTSLGPAVGGVRMRPYANDIEALNDALRLSRAMTYKAAMADLPLGGGKSVIVGNPALDKSPALWEVFGRCLEKLGGDYIAAEDMGTNPSDMDAISRVSRYVVGTSCEGGGTGDPANYTARGVLAGIQAALLWRFGDENISGRRIAIQGLGAVGAELVAALSSAGADLVVSDIRDERAEEIAGQYGAKRAAPEDIHRMECDVFAPCAVGGVLTEPTVRELRCEVVAGSANNQLASIGAGKMLALRRILYAPDYVINAGGLIGATATLVGIEPAEREAKIKAIGTGLLRVFLKAEREMVRTEEAANLEAEAVIWKKLVRKNIDGTLRRSALGKIRHSHYALAV